MTGIVKHYKNTMQGIPQLSNAWGSMIALLDAVLINGFNFKAISSLSKSTADAITATITVGTGHGFIDRQVVRIVGSSNGWDGDYKVLSSTTNSVVVECDAAKPTTIVGTSSISTAPLDFEIVFSTPQGSAEPKRAYRSKDPDSLGLILLVHDFCMSGAAATGAKFAKVGVVSSMSDIDTITGTQMPYDAVTPNANWGWDGTYHGWAKWYYAQQEDWSYYSTYDMNSPTNYNRPFRIVGDMASFVVLTHSYYAYGFLEFDDVLIGGKNTALYAAGLHQSRGIGQSSGVYSWSRGGFGSANYSPNGNSYAKAHLWFDANGMNNPAQAGCQAFLVFPSATAQSIANVNPNNSVAVASRDFVQAPIFDKNLKFRGVLPFFRLCTIKDNNELPTQNGIVLSRWYLDYGDYWFGINLEER